MEPITWMDNPGFLKIQLTKAVGRINQYSAANLPPSVAIENTDFRVATLLLGFATLLYAVQQQVPRSNREADRQEKAVNSLTQMIKKDLYKTGFSNEIFVDILHSRTLGDVAYDRLVTLFRLLGVADEDRVATLLPSFLAWSRDEAEFFRVELPRAGRNEMPIVNMDIDLVPKPSQKSPPPKPTKKLNRNKTQNTLATAH